MNRLVHPYIAFISLAIVAIIVGGVIWLGNNQLAPIAAASPSPQTSTVVSYPSPNPTGSQLPHPQQSSTVASSSTPNPITTEWQHYINKAIGFQMDIPKFTINKDCNIPIPLKLSDNNGHVTIFHEYSLDANCKKTSVPSVVVPANIWVGKATNFAQAQKFYQDTIGDPSCKLIKEEWIEQEQAGQSSYRLDVDNGLDCSYNGVTYFKKAGIAVHYNFPLKTARVFDGDIDSKIVHSIKPLVQ